MRNLFYEKVESCITEVSLRPPFLTGKGVLVAVIDSGIDYMNFNFRNKDGSTRILALWDQTIIPNKEKGWNPPVGFSKGVEFDKKQINEALAAPTRIATYEIVPSRDFSGHGTSVAGIAAGNGTLSELRYAGVADESELIIVKLGLPMVDSFPRTTELMRALDYVTKKAIEYNMPIAINLSFGNTYGAHDGTSLLERYINNISEIGRNVICVGSGNEGNARGHFSGTLQKKELIELAISQYELSISVQIWKNYNDIFSIDMISPSGKRISINLKRSGTQRILIEQTELLIFVGEPSPYSVNQEIFIDFIPVERYLNGGIWAFEFTPIDIITGDFNLYLPSQIVRSSTSGFFMATPEVTLTIPSTASRVITVGAYENVVFSYADFSGRGYVMKTENREREKIVGVKPDIVAPGVNIKTVQLGDTYGTVTGTSFATPIVTGAAALMMEWGIVRGNDPYLYGEKVKAYMMKGAKKLPGFTQWPNPQAGWGALCVENSLPL